MAMRKTDTLFCSFCGKSYKEVKKLIAGPSVCICNECVDICIEIINDDAQREAAGSSAKQSANDGKGKKKGKKKTAAPAEKQFRHPGRTKYSAPEIL